MILVVGGAAAGKRRFVQVELGLETSAFSTDVEADAAVIYGVQELLRARSAVELFPTLRNRRVVICDEVGCGIVPVDPGERAWREEVGRLCCLLAAEADVVVRVFCGIGSVIKGAL